MGERRRSRYAPAMSESPITPEIVAEHGLSPEEYERVLHALGREPNLTELGIFSVMWSEHCSYKSSRVHLKKLPTSASWVIQGPGENAGVIDIGDGLAAVFKMESHNHPSYIEPYQGAATGVGGILRDVFTMGARPVANLNALRFGRPDHPKMRHLIAGVVAGIGGYGNCVGVPTVGGEVDFHPAYDGNILVNAMTVGVAEAAKIFYSAASGVGNPIVYVGSKTGRDGIHGATMASADFSEDSEEKRPTVQVGDPFTEKLLIEACLELMASDAIVAIQDMGAAGLTSSSVEMASKGGVGIELDMNAVPCREQGMTPYEMMLSESQERMLMVLKPGRESEAAAIFTQMGAGLRGDRPGHRHRPYGAEMEWRGRRRHPARPARRRGALLRPSLGEGRGARAARRRARMPGHRRGPADADGVAGPRQPPLDLRAVRPEGRRRHAAAAGRRRRPGPRPRHHEGAGDHHRLHPALLPRRPRRGRQAGDRRGLAQPLRGRREAARRHRLHELRQSRSGPRSWASSSAASRAWRRRAASSNSRSSPATSPSTTRPGPRTAPAGRSCPPRRSAASA